MSNCRSLLVALIAVGCSTRMAGAADKEVTFKNSGEGIRYVFAFQGPDGSTAEPCKEKKNALPPLGVGPEPRKVAFSTGTKLCYALSYTDDASKPPYFTGVADAGSTVDVGTAHREGSADKQHSAGLMTGSGEPKFAWPIGKFPRPDIRFLPILPYPPIAHTVAFETVIAIYRDPFTLPHTATRCTSEAWGNYWPGGPEWRICNGYATDCQWMERRLILSVKVTAPDLTSEKLQAMVNECIQTAAVSGALAGVVASLVTPGAGFPAAEAVFVETLKACLIQKLINATIDIQLRNEGGWTNWSAC